MNYLRVKRLLKEIARKITPNEFDFNLQISELPRLYFQTNIIEKTIEEIRRYNNNFCNVDEVDLFQEFLGNLNESGYLNEIQFSNNQLNIGLKEYPTSQ